MNQIETAQILSCLKVAFPGAYNGVNIEQTVNLWARLFADDDYQTVSKAVDSLICNREAAWTPSIGEVKAEMAKLNPLVKYTRYIRNGVDVKPYTWFLLGYEFSKIAGKVNPQWG